MQDKEVYREMILEGYVLRGKLCLEKTMAGSHMLKEENLPVSTATSSYW
jgi:hypothetical protein